MPGLLQTEDYARAVFRATGRFPDDGIDLRVRIRMERQDLLRREFGIDLTFFIPEQVLRSTMGSPRVMNDQLLHLALITARPWCTVRVVPASFSLGFLGGPFELIYRSILLKLRDVSLDEGQSRALLARVANEYDIPEDRDGVAEE